MRILGLDSATRATAVALVDLEVPEDGGPSSAGRSLPVSRAREARDDPPAGARPGHTRCLLALIEELVEGAGGWGKVDRIAVGVGPGTFTGLRIGVATAHGLARAWGITLVGVSTLTSIAARARAALSDGAPGACPPLLALIDARRGEVFAAAWAPDADPRLDPPVLRASVLSPEALARVAASLPGKAVAVGDGAVEFRAVLEPIGVVVPPDGSGLHWVSAREHCLLAARTRPGRADAVLPMYLRPSDAELSIPR